MKDGFGDFIWNSGPIAGNNYSGEWQENKMHGQGTNHYPDGNIYKGEWLDGLKHGEGEFVWMEKHEKYVGMWENDEFYGHGQYTYANGDKLAGEW